MYIVTYVHEQDQNLLNYKLNSPVKRRGTENEHLRVVFVMCMDWIISSNEVTGFCDVLNFLWFQIYVLSFVLSFFPVPILNSGKEICNNSFLPETNLDESGVSVKFYITRSCWYDVTLFRSTLHVYLKKPFLKEFEYNLKWIHSLIFIRGHLVNMVCKQQKKKKPIKIPVTV